MRKVFTGSCAGDVGRGRCAERVEGKTVLASGPRLAAVEGARGERVWALAGGAGGKPDAGRWGLGLGRGEHVEAAEGGR